MPVQIPIAHHDHVIADLAARQHGVAARRQLLAAGLTRSMIEERLGSGHLIRLHRGVYAVGHKRLRREGHWLAAVLAVGPEAVLSHRHAAALHCLRSVAASQVDVSTPADRRSPRNGSIRIYARRTLDPADVAGVDGIPTTSVARTLVDLAAVLPQQQLNRAVSEAERLGLFDLTAVDATMARSSPRGRAALEAALADHRTHGETITRSELEITFLALLDDHGLPRPKTNAIIEGMEVDAYWPASDLVVELDGYAFHRHRRAFQRDRTKGNDLTAAGYVLLRFTYADVTERPADVADRLRAALSRASAAARPPRRSALPAR